MPFQSTHPVRGATAWGWCCARWSGAFQSTHPVRGATDWDRERNQPPEFQSTHPVRGATRNTLKHEYTFEISIHAPREGCDVFFHGRPVCIEVFQSTHPVRGATPARWRNNSTRRFQSTHPVRGATRISNSEIKTFKFQSTHPVRGATLSTDLLIRIHRYFNPRTP